MTLAPWDDHRASISPEEYEKSVADLLHGLGRNLPGFRVKHLEKISVSEGSYKIDVTARFTGLGADFLILVECKDHARPVERADVQVLAQKIASVHAQKGILFSTNGFQKGAIEFAKANRIALVRFVEGELTYETRSMRPPNSPRPKPPPWAKVPAYVGILTSAGPEGRWFQSVVDPQRTVPLAEFVVGTLEGDASVES